MKETFENEPWFVEYELSDGARLCRLCYRGFDLLTTSPNIFHPPFNKVYGEYEKRPVYGYDDCFPSVERCRYPGKEWMVPDHGELCWLEWEVERLSDKLIFSTESKMLPIVFKRVMHFKQRELFWQFSVMNHGSKELPFQHVMHPLIKLDQIQVIGFPDYEEVWNQEKESISFEDPDLLSRFLLNSHEGGVYMLYLQKIRKGLMSWKYKNGLNVRMNFPIDLFPTLGIWWNNSGYPDKEGCCRNECAFEPIAGQRSTLYESSEKGLCQLVEKNSEESWEITWSIT